VAAPSLDPSLRPYVPASYFDASNNLTVSQEQAATVAQAVQSHVQSLPPAEQQLYLALLNSPDFSPGADISTAALDVDLNKLDQAEQKIAQAIADSSVSNFLGLAEDVNALSKVLIIQASQARDAAHQQQISQLAAAQADLLAQAKQQTNAANDLASSAKTALIFACVGSALSIGGAMMQFGGAAKAFAKGKSVGKDFEGLDGEMKTNLKQQKSLTAEISEETKTKNSSAEKANDSKAKLNKEAQTEEIQDVDAKKSDTASTDQSKKLADKNADKKNTDANASSEKNKSDSETMTLDEKKQKLAELQTQEKELQKRMEARDSLMRPTDRLDHMLGGGGQGLEKMGTLMSSLSNYYNQMGQSLSQADQAVGSAFAARAQDDDAKAETQKDIQGHLDDLVKSMIAAAKDLQDAKAQAMESMTRV
jgi:hypothetical protein